MLGRVVYTYRSGVSRELRIRGVGLALEAVRDPRTFQPAVLYVGVVFELRPLPCALAYGCWRPWPRVKGALAGVSEGPSSGACNTGLHKRKSGPDSKFPPFPLLVVKSAGPKTPL
jgi:hypothetical protein